MHKLIGSARLIKTLKRFDTTLAFIIDNQAYDDPHYAAAMSWEYVVCIILPAVDRSVHSQMTFPPTVDTVYIAGARSRTTASFQRSYESTTYLIHALTSDNYGVRRRAVMQLDGTRDPQAISLLFGMIRNDDRWIAKAARASLQSSRDVRVQERLSREAEPEAVDVRDRWRSPSRSRIPPSEAPPPQTRGTSPRTLFRMIDEGTESDRLAATNALRTFSPRSIRGWRPKLRSRFITDVLNSPVFCLCKSFWSPLPFSFYEMAYLD